LLSRLKGRDFYDVMFLLGQTSPDYTFLMKKFGIHDFSELKTALNEVLVKTDLKQKAKDFEHLLFSKVDGQRVLAFKEFILQIQ
jgi:hypothetical protein